MTDWLNRAKRYHDEISRVLMEKWDPIGVQGIEEAQDEYDAYVAGVYRHLIQHASRQELIDYLWEVEREGMGLRGDGQRTRAAVDHLLEVRSTMESAQIVPHESASNGISSGKVSPRSGQNTGLLLGLLVLGAASLLGLLFRGVETPESDLLFAPPIILILLSSYTLLHRDPRQLELPGARADMSLAGSLMGVTAASLLGRFVLGFGTDIHLSTAPALGVAVITLARLRQLSKAMRSPTPDA